MSHAILSLLKALEIQPVLVDVGATGGAPPLWRKIASESIYIGFDPDEREMRHSDFRCFTRIHILDRVATEDPNAEQVHFYLTRSPQCSSTLPPDTAELSEYLFSDSFAVERETDIPAVTLSQTLTSLGLTHVDWMKIDTQGTDLRLFASLPQTVRSQTLAVDLEPGLINAYIGEDLFVDVHRRLMAEGFWLSRMPVHGSVRMRASTRAELAGRDAGLNSHLLMRALRPSPGWVEARYLRTVESLEERDAVPRDYVLLWAFALLDSQPGFALDLALAYSKRFGEDRSGRIMSGESLNQIKSAARRARIRQTALIPIRLLRRMEAVWKR